MRYAIIDNSTMTAVQRLLGQVPVINKLCLDGDIVAFENMIQAILFYDKIFYIDDYKAEFKSNRRNFFYFMEPIEINAFPYNEIIKASTQSVDDLILRVHGGKIDQNDFGKFLKMLRMHTTFTWDMNSSNFFLTMKMLSGIDNINIDKYTKIMDMIFLERLSGLEASAEIKNKRCDLIGSDGYSVENKLNEFGAKYKITPQVYAFSSSLNWLSLRTAFYTIISSQYKADVFLHPIRSSFQLSLAPRLGLPEGSFKPILSRLSGEVNSCISDIKRNSDPVIAEMNLPLFSAWLVEKCNDPLKMIETALSIRNSEIFSSARMCLNDIEDLIGQPNKKNYIKECNMLAESIRNTADNMRELYGVKTRSGIPISPIILFINALGKLKGMPQIPNLPIKIPLPDKLIEIGMRTGFKGLYKSIIEDLTSVQGLGNIHEKLTSRSVYEKEPIEILAKQEEIKYFGKSSHWKRPM